MLRINVTAVTHPCRAKRGHATRYTFSTPLTPKLPALRGKFIFDASRTFSSWASISVIGLEQRGLGPFLYAVRNLSGKICGGLDCSSYNVQIVPQSRVRRNALNISAWWCSSVQRTWATLEFLNHVLISLIASSYSSGNYTVAHKDQLSPRRLGWARIVIIVFFRTSNSFYSFSRYLPSFPYQDDAVLHIYAGLLCLFLAYPQHLEEDSGQHEHAMCKYNQKRLNYVSLISFVGQQYPLELCCWNKHTFVTVKVISVVRPTSILRIRYPFKFFWKCV